MKKFKFYQQLPALFLILSAISEVRAEDLSSYNKPREDLIFLQELADGVEGREEAWELFKFNPKISNQVSADLNFDDNYRATSKQNEYKETQLVGRLTSKLNLNNNLFIRSFIKLSEASKVSEDTRRSASANGSGDRSFENLGLHLEELVAGYKKGRFGLVVGKFNLNFGTVWQQGFGIWYSGIGGQYRQKEKLGTRVNYNLGDSKKYGDYVFTLSTFTNDRKNFDGSLLTKRDSASKSSSRPGDTRSLFDSYCASMNIKFDFSKNSELTYHASYVNLAVNEKSSPAVSYKIADQKGVATAFDYKHKIVENFGINSFAEYVEIKNLGGNSAVGEKYLTVSVTGKIYEKFNLTLARANQKNRQSSTGGFDRTLLETSAGYSFGNSSLLRGLLLQVGYKQQRTNYQASIDNRNSVGAMMVYSKEI